MAVWEGRGWWSRSHSEGLTSHRSYGRTRSSRGPPTSIARKVSRPTWAKDHEGCISHRLLSHKLLAKLTRFPFSRRRREEPDVGGGIRVALLVAEHQRGSSTVPPDQPVHQLVQLEPLPTVPWTAAGQWRGTADTS